MKFLRSLALATSLLFSPLKLTTAEMTVMPQEVSQYNFVLNQVKQNNIFSKSELEEKHMNVDALSLLAVQEHQFEKIYDKVLHFTDSLDFDLDIFRFVVRQESAYQQIDPFTGKVTTSWADARGASQLLPSTLTLINNKFETNFNHDIAFSSNINGVDELFPASITFLDYLMKQFPEKKEDYSIEYALASYNWREGKVRRLYNKHSGHFPKSYWSLPQETKGYVTGWHERGREGKEELKTKMMEWYFKKTYTYYQNIIKADTSSFETQVLALCEQSKLYSQTKYNPHLKELHGKSPEQW